MKVIISKNKIKKIKYFILVGTIIGSITSLAHDESNNFNSNQSKEITVEDVRDMIYNSSSLTQEEKKYLFNSDFFKDVLSTINNSKESIYQYQKKFKDIDIVSFEKTDDKEGYYTRNIEPNILHIAEYEQLSSLNKDTIAHEFIHLCQNNKCEYNLLVETTAEIISAEYFELSRINAYIDEVNTIKVLMEIIGPEPIWNYVFTNDFSEIDKNIKPYLKDKERNSFINCLKINLDDKNQKKESIKELNNLLNILYEKKYKSNIEDDLIISLIRSREATLKRYYFNSRFIKPEYSFYRNNENEKEEKLSFEEAYMEGLLIFFNNNDIISYNEYIDKLGKDKVFYVNIDGIVNNGQLEIVLPIKTYLPTIEERLKGKIILINHPQ